MAEGSPARSLTTEQKEISSADPVEKPSPPHDPCDSATWKVPVVCKDCNKKFELPYRHLQAGVVFHCPHCHGSWVATLPIYRMVYDRFESFFEKFAADRARALADRLPDAELKRREQQELDAFRRSLDQMAETMRPAGKMIKRKGLASMFT
jgi:hypothetical protein